MYEDYGDFGEYDVDMEYPTELVTSNPNPKAARAMRTAGKLRRQGWDASDALAEGWRRATSKSNPATFEPSPLLVILAIAAIGTALYKWKTGKWWWQSLGLGLPTAKKLLVGKPVTEHVPAKTPYTRGDTIVCNVT